MVVLTTLAGVAMIALVIHDIFTVLFRPGAESRFSRGLIRSVWTLLRRLGKPRVLALAGPLALATLICSWAILLVLGWALIYVTHYPGDFTVTTGTRTPILGATHVSLATITTLGSSSAVPRVAWLQIISPIESMIGFGLLTAAVAYLLQLYPVLSRRRALAYEIHLLAGSASRLSAPVARMEPTTTSQLYAELVSRLVAVDRDLVKFPIAYYFAETDPRFALATALPELTQLARQGSAAGNAPSVRLRASMLQQAVDDFALSVAERFLTRPHHSAADALRAYAHDHLHGRKPSAHRPSERTSERAAPDRPSPTISIDDVRKWPG